jgi:preprotein translocase subunit SecD
MLSVPKWKIFLALIVSFYGFYVLSYNFNVKDGKNKLNLGLDLRGGAYLLLEINQNAYFEEKISSLKEEIRDKLRSSATPYVNLKINKQKIIFNLAQKEVNLYKIFADIIKDITILQKGDNVEISYSENFIKEQKINILEQSLDVVRRRVDETGTTEPLIQPQGLNRIILQVPGIENPEILKRVLGRTAKMSFHLLHPEKPIVSDLFYVPSGYMISKDHKENIYYLVKEKADLLGDMLTDARVNMQQGLPQINFKFDALGARKFAEITSANVGVRLGIILDDKIISAPNIREPIIGGSGVINGNYSMDEASELALLLRSGSLPAPLDIIEERTVGPSLGSDSIKSGKQAILIAFILVLILMVILYKKFGFFAFIALLMNVIFIFAILTSFGATLTLPGMAGIVLTIGMAVDTNVLIFERIREESRSDKSIYAVIDHGFNNAFKTVIDSNLTSLIIALILFNLGSGPVKGFAVTLAIGIIASMFSAIFLTKLLIYAWVKFAKPKKINV